MSPISEQALKDKLKNLAKSEKTSVGELLKKLALERFIARVACSNHRENFVFKGGNLLNYYLPIGRQTKDIDFLLTGIEANQKAIKEAIEQIIEVELNDGFELKFEKLSLLDQVHMAYPGYRVIVSIQIKDGKLRDKMR